MTLEDAPQVKAWLAAEIGCDALALERLDRLVALLEEENQHQNLVSQGSLGAVWVRHVADSAQLLLHLSGDTPKAPWFDLGSGAGFPGIVIAICRSNVPVVLVESRARRIDWLTRLKDELGLFHVELESQRLENVPDRPACVISARAFAPLAQLIALAARFSTSETQWLLPKGRSARKELAEMPASIRTMFHVEQSLTDRDSAILIGRGRPTPSNTHRR